MENRINPLRGAVLARYKTLKEFSDALGWHKAKTYRIVSGAEEPKLDDMKKIADTLGIDKHGIADIFFADYVAK
jgi:predicted transcriptional regulator